MKRKILLFFLTLALLPVSARAASIPRLEARPIYNKDGPCVALAWETTPDAAWYEVWASRDGSVYARMATVYGSAWETASVPGVAIYYKVKAVRHGSVLSETNIALGLYRAADALCLETEELTLALGETAVLSPRAFSGAEQAVCGIYTYTVSDESVCTVEDGVITALGLGQGEIYVSPADNPGVCCTVGIRVVVSADTPLELLHSELLRTWASPYLCLQDGETPVTILSNTDGREFGSVRNGGARYHAGVDFTVTKSVGAGTPVYAMTTGTVLSFSKSGYWAGTGQLTVQNEDGTVVRYGEVRPLDEFCEVGKRVEQGEQIAALVKNTSNGCTMIHLELYMGTDDGMNGDYHYVPKKTYKRRNDLLDPTFLRQLVTGEPEA